jgi:hypothetical protein
MIAKVRAYYKKNGVLALLRRLLVDAWDLRTRLPTRMRSLERRMHQLEMEQQRTQLLQFQASYDLIDLHRLEYESGQTALPEEPPLQSSVCRYADFQTGVYYYWCDKLGLRGSVHRKKWEYVYILRALHQHGMLQPGRSGVGFGVGREPLASILAGMGCTVLGTDIGRGAVSKSWLPSGQHAAALESLYMPHLCSRADFDQRVSFRAVDMNHIPGDISGFNFCWSSCSLEHLGSLELGTTFIERSLDCLVPGGVAVHTTEFNISSNTETVGTGHSVIYRRQDLENFAERMRARGFKVAPLDLELGASPLDRYVDAPPYLSGETHLGFPHLKLILEGYISTSVGIIISKPA